MRIFNWDKLSEADRAAALARPAQESRADIAAVALEVVKQGVLFNAMAPGFIQTPMSSPELRQWVIDTTPTGRCGEPRDIAAAALYLASEDSSFMVG